MKHYRALLFCFYIVIVACQIPAHVTVKNHLRFQLFTSDQELIVLRQGASFKLFKDGKQLAQSSLEKNNEVAFGILSEPPPYQFELGPASIDSIEASRVGPIDTQGGLLPLAPIQSVMISPFPLIDSFPEESTVLPVLKGEIKQDLQIPQHVNFEAILSFKKADKQ